MLNCPWLNFTPDNLYFCESYICGWIRQPANAWSSFALVIAGLIILYLTFLKRQKFLHLYGWILVFLGIGTFFYHATTALWAGIFDLMGMFLLIFYLLVTILWELFKIKRSLAVIIFILGSILMTTLHAIKPNLGTPFFAIIALFAFILELRVAKNEPKSSKKYLLFFIAFAILALIVWGIDATKIVCDPNNHIFQGHALWHELTAIAFFFLYFHLSKVKLPKWKLL